jgi:hypothetical protein
MSEVTELQARNFSVRELAEALESHTDPAVRILIQKLMKQWYGEVE